MKTRFLPLVLVIFVLFSGCTAEITLSMQKDSTVLVDFKGSAGDSFAKMIQTANESEENFYDVDSINSELLLSGFSDVNVNADNLNLSVSMKDQGLSFLNKSGIVQKNGKKISAILNPSNLLKFYTMADDQLVMFLDLLMSPVFNEEQMSEEEYLEVFESLYGESIAKELADSHLLITLIGSDGKKTTKTIPMVKVLCLSEEISIHSSN